MTSILAAPAPPATRPVPGELARSRFQRSIAAGEAYFVENAEAIARCASAMADRFFDGAQLLVFGGGSATTDAQHNSVEFVHPALPGCRALPATSLTNDGATVTSILLGDDPGSVYEHQIRLFGRSGDIALAFAGSPPLPAVSRGLDEARERGLVTVAMLVGSHDPGRLADHQFRVADDDALVAQELHLATYHMLWELVHIVLNHRGIPQPESAGATR